MKKIIKRAWVFLLCLLLALPVQKVSAVNHPEPQIVRVRMNNDKLIINFENNDFVKSHDFKIVSYSGCSVDDSPKTDQYLIEMDCVEKKGGEIKESKDKEGNAIKNLRIDICKLQNELSEKNADDSRLVLPKKNAYVQILCSEDGGLHWESCSSNNLENMLSWNSCSLYKVNDKLLKDGDIEVSLPEAVSGYETNREESSADLENGQWSITTPVEEGKEDNFYILLMEDSEEEPEEDGGSKSDGKSSSDKSDKGADSGSDTAVRQDDNGTGSYESDDDNDSGSDENAKIKSGKGPGSDLSREVGEKGLSKEDTGNKPNDATGNQSNDTTGKNTDDEAVQTDSGDLAEMESNDTVNAKSGEAAEESFKEDGTEVSGKSRKFHSGKGGIKGIFVKLKDAKDLWNIKLEDNGDYTGAENIKMHSYTIDVSSSLVVPKLFVNNASQGFQIVEYDPSAASAEEENPEETSEQDTEETSEETSEQDTEETSEEASEQDAEEEDPETEEADDSDAMISDENAEEISEDSDTENTDEAEEETESEEASQTEEADVEEPENDADNTEEPDLVGSKNQKTDVAESEEPDAAESEESDAAESEEPNADSENKESDAGENTDTSDMDQKTDSDTQDSADAAGSVDAQEPTEAPEPTATPIPMPTDTPTPEPTKEEAQPTTPPVDESTSGKDSSSIPLIAVIVVLILVIIVLVILLMKKSGKDKTPVHRTAPRAPREDEDTIIPEDMSNHFEEKTEPAATGSKPSIIYSVVANNKGRVRGNNEDNFYLNGEYMARNSMDDGALLSSTCTDNIQLYAVCDGMGGTDSGEEASYGAVSELDKYREQYGSWIKKETLTGALRSISEKINQEARQRGQKSGTTIVLMLIKDGKLVLSNVGDSRIYLFRDQKLSQLSLDHSKVQRMISMGILTPEQAKTDPSRHVITQYLGMPSDIKASPYFAPNAELRTDDIYLLCSDGLTDMVEDAQIEEILRKSKDLKSAVQELLKTALENGGKDNVTIMLVQSKTKGDRKNSASKRNRR